MPALPISRDHSAGCLKTFTDGTTALLGLTEGTSELIGHPGVFGPVVPAVGLKVSLPRLGNLVDQFFFLTHPASSISSAICFNPTNRLWSCSGLLSGFVGEKDGQVNLTIKVV